MQTVGNCAELVVAGSAEIWRTAIMYAEPARQGCLGAVGHALAHQSSSSSAGQLLITRLGSSPRSSARWQP